MHLKIIYFIFSVATTKRDSGKSGLQDPQHNPKRHNGL